MSLEPAQQLNGGGTAMERAEGDAGASTVGRLSLDLTSAGGGGAFRPSTLLDEYERLAIEAQLDRAVLRRSYSEPSPSRLVVALQDKEAQPAAATTSGRRAEKETPGAGRGPTWRSWLLEALKRLLCWLGTGGSWGGRCRRREEERAVPCPPVPAPASPTPPRVQLLDYPSTSTT